MSVAQALHYAGSDLDSMSQAVRYHKWIIRQMLPYVGKSVLEVGAGSGDVTSLLREAVPEANICALEPSANLGPALVARFSEDPFVTAHASYLAEWLPVRNSVHDSALYINVMEHVEDDYAEMRMLKDCLHEQGHVLIFVPALPFLYSNFDRSVGHYRRYTKARLMALAESSGFEVVKCHYCDFPGIFPWLVMMKWFKGGLNPRSVALYDRLVVPWMTVLEDRVRPPVGKNLLLVGRLPARC